MNKPITVFLFAIVLSASNISAQKKERYGWGQYTEVGGINYQNFSYTMFNTTKEGFHWTADVITIRFVFTLAGDIPYKHKLKSV